MDRLLNNLSDADKAFALVVWHLGAALDLEARAMQQAWDMVSGEMERIRRDS